MTGVRCAEGRLVSIIVPALNEAPCLDALWSELCRVCDLLPYRFEFLFVDDGSTDGTHAALTRLRAGDARVKFITLSRNFGHQAALAAGLDAAAGDAAIMMDGDLQHPPALIPELLVRWEAGYDVVNTVRSGTAGIGLFKRVCSRAYYRLLNSNSPLRVAPGSADFRLVSRRVIDVLRRLPERRRFYRGLIPWLGFPQAEVTFTAPARFAGVAKYSLSRNFPFAVDGLLACGAYPLRKLLWGGLLLCCLSALGLLVQVAVQLSGLSHAASALPLCVVFLGGVQLLVAGALGEYLGRILEQVNARPLYLVRDSSGTSRDETLAEEQGGCKTADSERVVLPFAS